MKYIAGFLFTTVLLSPLSAYGACWNLAKPWGHAFRSTTNPTLYTFSALDWDIYPARQGKIKVNYCHGSRCANWTLNPGESLQMVTGIYLIQSINFDQCGRVNGLPTTIGKFIIR